MSYLEMALENTNHELPTGKVAYNALLIEARQLQAGLDNEAVPLCQREALLPEFRVMIHNLSTVINAKETNRDN